MFRIGVYVFLLKYSRDCVSFWGLSRNRLASLHQPFLREWLVRALSAAVVQEMLTAYTEEMLTAAVRKMLTADPHMHAPLLKEGDSEAH